MFFVRKFRPINIILIILSLSTILLTSHEAYFPLLALISIVQGSVFIKNKNHLIASKYIIYAALLILCGSQMALGIEKQLLLILLTLKSFAASYEYEIEDANIFYPNIIMIFSAEVLINGFSSVHLNTFIIVLLSLACLRTLLDKRIKSPTYIAPFFLILSLANPIYAIGVLLYIASLSFLIKTKEKVNGIILASALCIVFVDSTVFYKLMPETTLNGAGWIVSFLAACCISLYIEKIVKKEFKNKVSFNAAFLLIIVLASVGFTIITDCEISSFLNRPVPLTSAVLLILLNGVYLRLFSKTRLQNLLPSTETKTASFFKFKHHKGTVIGKMNKARQLSVFSSTKSRISKINTSSLAGIFLLSLIIMLVYLRWVA